MEGERAADFVAFDCTCQAKWLTVTWSTVQEVSKTAANVPEMSVVR